jgi:putative DNA primase/helicase
MDAEIAFQAAMAEAGIVTNDPITADGQIHRVHIDGHKRGSRNGAYVLHGDGKPAGWFQDFTSGIKATWKADGDWKPDPGAKQRMQAQKAQRQAEEHARHMEAASRAARIWEQATDCDGHPYLDMKRVKAWGLRAKGNDLLIPLRDSWGRLWSLQRIEPQGDGFTKRFMTGGRVKGLMHWTGDTHGHLLFVCEGYATAATIAEQTGQAAYVGFSAGNLLSVALELRDCFPHRRIIIAGDSDPVGRAKAEQAARSARAELSIPEFPEGVTGSDWNDLAAWRAEHGDH